MRRGRGSTRARSVGTVVLAGLLAGCMTDEGGPEGDDPTPTLPETPYAYDPPLPDHVRASITPGVDNTPPDNPITDAGATLGRVLFHDRRLSVNHEISCASCHRADAAFADTVASSAGFDGGATARNSMPILEVRYYARGRMFWDERATSVEDQVLRPIQDEVEMGLTLDELEARVAAASFYAPLFEAAFGDDRITRERIARALAQYVRSIATWSSRWDEAVATATGIADDLPGFTTEENRGKQIFFGQHDPVTRGLCGSCHMRENPLAVLPPGAPPRPLVNVALFQSIGPADNGLPPREGDVGVGALAGPQADNLFKPPTLRNVALTAPYMHDGRFATLEEVVDFYDHGITATPNLHPALRTPGGQPLRLNLSPADRASLVAFLRTLTDDAVARDPRFADPFASR